MKLLSVVIILFLCLGCSKNAYQIDKNAKLEPQFSLDATQFANENVIIRSCTKFEIDSSKVIVLNEKQTTVENVKTEKDSIQR